MKIVTQFPCAVREIENTWITLSDGLRLAARIWLPEDAEPHPVPGILEFLPYRKSDGTAERDMQLPAFGEPEASAPLAYETMRDPKPVRMVEHDRLQNTHRLRVCFDYGDVRQTRSGLTGEAIVWDTYEIKEGDPLSATVVGKRLGRWVGEGWSVRVATRSEMTCDAVAFHVINRMDAYESINGAEVAVFGQTW